MNDKIILFDGVCHFCNFWVKFVIAHDQKKQFKFAPLQSEIAQSLLKEKDLQNQDLSTVILIDEDKTYLQSDAALRICKYVDGFWKLIYVLIIIPSSFRNMVYRFVAKNRYRWFGKSESCMLPTSDLKDRFLV